MHVTAAVKNSENPKRAISVPKNASAISERHHVGVFSRSVTGGEALCEETFLRVCKRFSPR
jgi:hypothetical protein